MRPLLRICNCWGHCSVGSPSLATDIDIAALVTRDGCRASDPLSLPSPRLSPGLAISRHTGPRLSRPRSAARHPRPVGPAPHYSDHGPESIIPISMLKRIFWWVCKSLRKIIWVEKVDKVKLMKTLSCSYDHFSKRVKFVFGLCPGNFELFHI